MVRRHVASRQRPLLAPALLPTLAAALATAVLAALLFPALADAANRRISLTDYSWSEPVVDIDLGEHVTWYWVGPDLMHSITGDSDNAERWDSDPETNQPHHDLGFDYSVTFDQPGTYEFRCKLHSNVRGRVVVSDQPGDPASEPDPVPKIQLDLTPPQLRVVSRERLATGRRGLAMSYALNEVATIDVEYWREVRRGKGDRQRTARRYAGWTSWRGSIGYNNARLGAAAKRFRPRPGRYVAELWVTDETNNDADVQRVRFAIRKG